MLRSRLPALLSVPCITFSPVLRAQDWNSAPALALVERAVEARERAGLDTTLQRYRAQAEGIVLFLAQFGAGSEVAEHLVKADQVVVEVYWQAPNLSKQIITAWRERRYLPTDVRYHRDHLGIVSNDFGDRIRLGEGDEVRDVGHPLAGAMRTMRTMEGFYQYALGDLLVLRSGEREIQVQEVLFRPSDPESAAAIGTMHLDVESAALVQLRFGFTRAAYRQADLEDISVRLENALFDQRFWLPWRQDIQIRRRIAWLDFPVRTIIQGHWRLGDYDLGASFPAEVFAGGPYGGPPAAGPDSGWSEPLEDAVGREAGALSRVDLAAVRREAVELAGRKLLAHGPPARFAFGAVSDLIHVNRVQGLALGAGASLRLPLGIQVHPRVELGTSDHRVLGGVGLRFRGAQLLLEKDIRDVSDVPVISGVLNSLLAQEAGRDFGDYVLLERLVAATALPAGSGSVLEVGLGIERSRSLETRASPFSGGYEPNPALGVGTTTNARVAVRSASDGATVRVALEGGAGSRDFVRASVEGRFDLPAGPGRVRGLVAGGAGTSELPPYRAFPLGGRGTLVGEPFRGYWGRRMLLGRLEFAFPVPVPELRSGFAGTGRSAILAPFFAAGWAGGTSADLPHPGSGGIRPVLGVASELLFQALRVELGWAPRAGQVAVVADFASAWWPIL